MFNIANIEYTAVKVVGLNGKSTTYLPMYHKANDVLITSDLECIVNNMLSDELVIRSDLNCKHPSWGRNIANRNGTNLYNWLNTCPILEVKRKREPSRISGLAECYIDIFFVTPGLRTYNDAIGLKTLDCDSDHKAVELVLELGELEKAERILYYNYKTIRVSKFNRILDEQLRGKGLPLDRNANCQEIDNCVANLVEAFDIAMTQSIKKFEPYREFLPQLQNYILNLRAEK